MTLQEFIKDLQEEMEENGWQELPVTFATKPDEDLYWLSIYESDDGKSVIMDIGDEQMYSVVKADDLEVLENLVNNYIHNGYRLVGGISAVSIQYGYMYMQAVYGEASNES